MGWVRSFSIPDLEFVLLLHTKGSSISSGHRISFDRVSSCTFWTGLAASAWDSFLFLGMHAWLASWTRRRSIHIVCYLPPSSDTTYPPAHSKSNRRDRAHSLTHSSSSVWDPAEVTYGIRIINTGVEMDITYKQQTDKMNLLLIEAKHIIALEAKVRNALVK